MKKLKKYKRKVLIIFLVLIMALSPFVAISLFKPKSTMAADILLNFDEGYGSDASDTNSTITNSTITNAVWKTEDLCKTGKCLYFDGTGDYVSHTDDASLDMGSSETVTIEGWFRTSDITSGTRTLISKYETSGADGGYKITMNSDGQIVFGIDNDNGSFPSDSVTSSASYDDNAWHHFATVKDGATSMTLYIDAISVGTPDTSPASDVSNDDTFYIGSDNGTSNDWVGFIDEIKILRTARTAMEVKSDFLSETPNRGATASFSSDESYLSNGLVGYWKMDEISWASDCSTKDVYDSSGNGFDGTACPNSAAPSLGAGKFGSGGVFDGNDDYIEMGTVNHNIGTGDFTLSAWVYPTVLTADTWRPVIQINSWKPGMYTNLQSSNQWGMYWLGEYASGNSLSVNNWYHLVIVRQSGMIRFYQNSTQTPNTYNITTSVSNGDLEIGRTNPTQSQGGTIDEVRIYNRALSPAEVSKLYNWAPGPVGHWKLDENTGTTAYDTSSNGNDLTLTNSPTYTIGKLGSGINFAGSNAHLVRVDDSDFDFGVGESFAIETWIKHDTASAQELIVSKFNEAGYKILMESDGNITCGIDYDSTWTPTDSVTSTAATYDDYSWHHVACVKNVNTSLTLYIDGVSVGTPDTSLTNSTLANSDPLYIGINADGTSNDWVGKIDDIRIYDYARTMGQITEDMNADHPAPGSPIGSAIAHWRFDEGYGTTANDDSANANNLTLNTASWTNAGKYGKAWNGTGGAIRMSRPTDPDLEFSATDDFTLSIWYKSDSATNPTAIEYLVNDGAAAGSAGYAIYADTNGYLCFGIDDDTSWGPDVASCTTTDVYDATWHHITAVRNTMLDKTYIYVDAVLKDSDTDSTTATLDSSPTFYIGDIDTDDAGSGEEFEGDIDEVSIYRSALTPSQTKTLYNQGSATVMGATSTNSSNVPSWSANNEYCPPSQGSACTAPVGHWKMDENTGTTAYDTSGNNYFLVTGGAPNWAPGKHGPALSFDGTNYLHENNVSFSNLVITGDVTVSAWVNRRDTGNIKTLINKEGSGPAPDDNRSYTFQIRDDNKLSLRWQYGATSTNETTKSTVTLTNGTDVWIHLTAVRDTTANEVTFYENGQQLGSKVSYTNEATGGDGLNGNLVVGALDTNPVQAFNGLIDNVQIYDYTRTPSQVAWDYNRSKPVGWWKFDESSWTNDCSTDAVFDSSGNSNHGNSCPNTTGQTTPETGKFNNAIHFDDSNDYISIPDNNSLDLTDNLSISAWVKTDANEADNVIISKGTSYEMGINTDGDVYWDGVGAQVDDGSARVLTGTWHHIVITNNDTTTTYYVDGVQTSTSTAGIDSDNATALYIGYDGTNYFDGLIDDVRIYNYTLSTQQVKTIMNNGALRFD